VHAWDDFAGLTDSVLGTRSDPRNHRLVPPTVHGRVYIHRGWPDFSNESRKILFCALARDNWDPLLTVRGPLEPRRPPTRVLFARDGEVPRRLRMFDTDSGPVVVVIPHSRVADVSEAIVNKEVMVMGADSLTAAMESLRRQGIQSILIEGGGRLATSLLDEELVDRLYWIQAPRWLGTGTPAFTRAPISLDAAESWQVTERRALGPDTLLVVDRRLCLQV
ncbi:MAG: dihydrofolate reductase family protein, partial [Gemmatimonadetes bacterium]|nr:dihydrofolate reductase family protein [Gemmatimonadota bacterium]